MLGVIIATLGVIAAIILGFRQFKKYMEDRELTTTELYKLILQFFVILVIVLFLTNAFATVNVGYAKLVIDPVLRTVSEPVVGPQWFTRWPWTYTAEIYYATTSTEMWTDQESGERGEYPALHVLSRDGLDIEVDILIRYSLDVKSLVALYRSFPKMDYEDRAVSSVVREDVRDVISKYTALEIIEMREVISVDMTDAIYTSLVEEPSLHQALDEKTIQIDLRDIDPPVKFKEAIEAKLTAEQQKIQAEFERERIIILADAEAQKKIREAYGEAQAKITVANGTSEAIRIIQEQVGEEGWELFYSLQMLKEISPNVKVLIVTTGEGGVPIIYALPQDTNSTIPE